MKWHFFESQRICLPASVGLGYYFFCCETDRGECIISRIGFGVDVDVTRGMVGDGRGEKGGGRGVSRSRGR